MYEQGKGVIQSYVSAHMWYNLGAINGSDNGSNNRDIVAKEMSSAQIEEAQRKAKDCLKKSYRDCD